MRTRAILLSQNSPENEEASPMSPTCQRSATIYTRAFDICRAAAPLARTGTRKFRVIPLSLNGPALEGCNSPWKTLDSAARQARTTDRVREQRRHRKQPVYNRSSPTLNNPSWVCDNTTVECKPSLTGRHDRRLSLTWLVRQYSSL